MPEIRLHSHCDQYNVQHLLIYQTTNPPSGAAVWKHYQALWMHQEHFVHLNHLQSAPSICDPWPSLCWKSKAPHFRRLTCQLPPHLNEGVVCYSPELLWVQGLSSVLWGQTASTPTWAASQPDGLPGAFGVLKVRLEFWELPRVSSPRGPQESPRTPWGAVVAGAPWPSSVACSW